MVDLCGMTLMFPGIKGDLVDKANWDHFPEYVFGQGQGLVEGYGQDLGGFTAAEIVVLH